MIEILQASQAQIVLPALVICMAFEARHYMLKFSMQAGLHRNLFTYICVAFYTQLCLQSDQGLVTKAALPLKIRMRLVTCNDDLWISRTAQITWTECPSALAPDSQAKPHKQHPEYEHTW